MDKGIPASARELLARSAQLGDSHYQKLVPYKLQKSVCHNEVDTEKMRTELQSHAPPDVNGAIDVSEVLTVGYNIIMDCARRSTRLPARQDQTWGRRPAQMEKITGWR